MVQPLLASTGKGLRAVGSSNVVLQCFIKSGGIPSLPGAFPEAKLSMDLLNSSTDGSESNSSMVGRHSMTSLGISTVIPSSQEFASQYGLAIFK